MTTLTAYGLTCEFYRYPPESGWRAQLPSYYDDEKDPRLDYLRYEPSPEPPHLPALDRVITYPTLDAAVAAMRLLTESEPDPPPEPKPDPDAESIRSYLRSHGLDLIEPVESWTITVVDHFEWPSRVVAEARAPGREAAKAWTRRLVDCCLGEGLLEISAWRLRRRDSSPDRLPAGVSLMMHFEVTLFDFNFTDRVVARGRVLNADYARTVAAGLVNEAFEVSGLNPVDQYWNQPLRGWDGEAEFEAQIYSVDELQPRFKLAIDALPVQ